MNHIVLFEPLSLQTLEILPVRVQPRILRFI